MNVNIAEYYRRDPGPLLILGEPGTGKTTLLYELTTELVPGEANDYDPIPVPFELANWARERLPLVEWVTQELQRKYGVGIRLGKRWVENSMILPMLDGLDEVPTAQRTACVERIREYRRAYPGVKLVVSCREAEYRELSAGVDVPSAVVLKSLTRPEVEDYLNRNADKLKGLRLALDADPGLWELMTSPLMLWVGAFSCEGISPAKLDGSPVGGREKEARVALLDRYVDVMLQREGDKRIDDRNEFPHADAKRWLRETAAGMGRVGLFAFRPKDLGIKWLPELKQRVARLSMRAVVGLVFALVFGLCGGLFSREAVPTNTAGWSWTDAGRGMFTGSVVWLGLALLGGPVDGLLSGLFSELLYWVFVVTLGWPSALMRRYSARPASEFLLKLRLFAILWSQDNFFVVLVCALATGIAPSLGLARIPGFGAGLVSAGIVKASSDYIDHVIGRYLFVRAGYIPWRSEKFLQFAVQRVLMIRQGGSFRFVHRMLQEHLAVQAPSVQVEAKTHSGAAG